MTLAVQYAALVGRYVHMDRPATEEELAADPRVHTHGMSCLVAAVRDGVDELGLPTVTIVADYGYGYTIRAGDRWTFTVFPDEAAATELRLP